MITASTQEKENDLHEVGFEFVRYSEQHECGIYHKKKPLQLLWDAEKAWS